MVIKLIKKIWTLIPQSRTTRRLNELDTYFTKLDHLNTMGLKDSYDIIWGKIHFMTWHRKK